MSNICAAAGDNSGGDYDRNLIRGAAASADKEQGLLRDYLALSAQQIDDGDLAGVTVEGLLAKGRAKRRGQGAE